MTKNDMVRKIAAEMGIQQLAVKQVIQLTLDGIIECVASEGRLELPNNTVLVMHPLDGSPDPVVEYGIGRVSHRERIYNGNEPWSRAWVVRRVLEAAKNPTLESKLRNMPVPLTAAAVDEYMGAVLEAACDAPLETPQVWGVAEAPPLRR